MKILLSLSMGLLLTIAFHRPVMAQVQEGFVRNVPAETEGDERSRQSSLFIMEVDLKSMRLIWVETPDPETGEVERQLYYYLCYRAINRPIPQPSASEIEPKNPRDPEPSPPYFIPEFTLVTKDSLETEIISDAILPTVQKAINRKEKRQFKNSVTIVQPLPEPTTEEPNNANTLYGVAIFPNVDAEVDRFTVYMTGFSNGYRVVEGPDGNEILERKTIKQEFWRPGDQFDPQSAEFRFEGEPEWIYRPDPDVTVE